MKLKDLLLVLPLSSLAACSDKGDEQSQTEKTQSAVVDTLQQDREAVSGNLVASSKAETIYPQQVAAGKAIYSGKCTSCHAAGMAGAPKLGDAGLWQPRIAQGMDLLYKHAINGFKGNTGYMPPKGGYMTLSDDDVKTAVAYMVFMSQ
jgi:cytochrome c5